LRGSWSFTRPDSFCRTTTTPYETTRKRSFEYLNTQEALFQLVQKARNHPATEHATDLKGWLPSRVLVQQDEGFEEIWCAVSVRAGDGSLIRAKVRDLLFAALEEHLAPVLFEARSDWPTGDVGWFEAVRFGMP
jgi:hypothetical protein